MDFKNQKKNRRLIIAFCLFTLLAFSGNNDVPVKKIMQDIQTQLSGMADANTDLAKYPRSTKKDGAISTVSSGDWTSGFYPGCLWYMYDYTKNKKWETLARKWNAALKKEQYNKNTHDLGFMLFCSFGNGYRLTKDPEYKDIIIQGSKSLITRFNAKVGCLRSWDFNKEDWQFPVIIDNMMNLEMLFWATKITGDSVYYNIAKTHALTTMKNHYRPDNSSYHLVDYDTSTGQVRKCQTVQGAADESAWARGQAWGLYGYTVAYRETKDKRFLVQAQNIADFFIHHPNLPEDKIPYWDFNAATIPNEPRDVSAAAIPNEPRDVSAAAIAASGLLELLQHTNKIKKQEYFAVAAKMLQSLSSPAYRAKVGENNNFILKHSVGHKPAGSEIDVPLIYADYYYMEALLRYNKLKK